jgi:hypothetical protein
MGFPESKFPVKGTYTAQSPSLYKTLDYDQDEIWREIKRVCDEDKEGKFTPGQQIYYNAPFFCNPILFRDPELERIINEYYYCTRLNIPLGKDLDSTSAWRIQCFAIIHTEVIALENRKIEMQRKNAAKHS